MKKKKHLKIFAAGGLALFMGVGTLCGVLISPMNSTSANVGATASSNSANFAGAVQLSDSVQTEGLIKPKEDDPVIFTTESGVNIKIGNALPAVNSLGSGNLKNFAYFTTSANSTTYTWVIIGMGSDPTQDNTTPAGIAIKNDTNASKKKYFSNLAVNTSEIPEGCVLCLANGVIASGAKNTTSCNTTTITDDDTLGVYEIWYGQHYYTDYVGEIKSTMDSYYTNGSLGLNAIKNNIVSVKLQTFGYYGSGVPKSSYHTISFNLSRTTESTSYVFPLSNRDNFKWSTYLTSAQAKLSSNWWLRSDESSQTVNYVYSSSSSGSASMGGRTDKFYYKYYHLAQVMNTSGGIENLAVDKQAGYRPAFCLKIF